MYGYIYKVTNKLNSKIYIGQKKSPTFLHEEYLGSGTLIIGARVKYGEENFSCELLKECCSQFELDMYEEYYIRQYKSYLPEVGYNISLGGKQNDKASIRFSRQDPEAIELKSIAKEYLKQFKKKKKKKKIIEQEKPKRFIKDPYNQFVIHKGNEKKYVDKSKLDEYYSQG